MRLICGVAFLLASLLTLHVCTSADHCSADCCSASRGTHGPVFEIGERSLLEVLAERLKSLDKSGELDLWQQNIQKHMAKKVDAPTPVAGLRRTTKARRWVYDPTLVVKQDIHDMNGNLIAAAGTCVNPLDHLAWGAPLVFLDGADEAQVKWATQHATFDKWVLVNGKPLSVSQTHGRPIYFDQSGLLTRRFKIQQIPARVSQEGRALIVEEIDMTGGT